MSLFVLDSDILSMLQAGNPIVQARVGEHDPSEIAITVITVDEQLRGWFTDLRRAKKPPQIARAYDRLARSVAYLSRTRILSFSETAIATFERLRKSKLNVGANDLRIAAIAMEYQAPVVTRNSRDFKCIPGLLVDDWSAPES